MHRRRFLFALAALPAGSAIAASVKGPHLGTPQSFDFSQVRERARAAARTPYQPPAIPAPKTLNQIDFDVVQKIDFRPTMALFPHSPFPVRLFHLNKYAQTPVQIYTVEGGQAREVLYAPDYFDYKDAALRRQIPANLGFAGFRLMNGASETDWLAFQGASYFRCAGPFNQYGMSARGIAIDVAMPTPEEFPLFRAFWIEPGKGHHIRIHALLDGPSLTGAYRFDCTRTTGEIMDVHAELFTRRPIARLGVAPLTSMFWYGENNRTDADDWRPEIHDSDGLALWTGAGERIWRPLTDPPAVQTTSFEDRGPRGFGLLQRDRNFDHYQDDSAFYNKRPSVWVEPRGSWGAGAVQLVEIPTDDEINDNIVAYWVPKAAVGAGDHLPFDYRLYWTAEEPVPATNVGHVIATRIGRGGVPGQLTPRKQSQHKFVVDFEGGPLAALAQRYDVDPVVTASRGTISNRYAIKVVGTNYWRGVFDIDPPGDAPVDLRFYLRLHGRTLTETWLYHYIPKKTG